MGLLALPLLESSASTTHLRLGVDHRGDLQLLPIWLAESLGYFADEGLAVSWGLVSSGANGGGQGAQVVVLPYVNAFSPALTPLKFKALAQLTRTPQVVLAVSRIGFPNGLRLKDLRDKRVAYAGKGSSSDVLLRTALDRAGLKTSQVELIESRHDTQVIEGLESGSIDALCYGDPLLTQLEQRGLVRVLVDGRQTQDVQQLFGGPLACACLMASEAFIEEHPLVCQKLVNGVVRALDWLMTASPSDLVAQMPHHLSGRDTTVWLRSVARSMDSFAGQGRMEDFAPLNALRTINRLEPQSRLQHRSIEDTYTHHFVERAMRLIRSA